LLLCILLKAELETKQQILPRGAKKLHQIISLINFVKPQFTLISFDTRVLQ